MGLVVSSAVAAGPLVIGSLFGVLVFSKNDVRTPGKSYQLETMAI